MNTNDRVKIEREYWEKEANGSDVARAVCDPGLERDCYDAIEPYLKPGKILEIGCGIGRMIKELSESCKLFTSSFYGIDISQSMLDFVKENTSKVDQIVKVKLCSGRSIPYPSFWFDSVYSIAVFQHIDDVGFCNYIEEAHRVLKPGGIFRFQFVIGDEKAAFSWQRSFGWEMKPILEESGFKIENYSTGIIFPQWGFVTAVKV